ncbi:MAG TPA: Gfo/Idh/MocA family oxidoreductase [Sediminispirochaeta sp.]|nr:Gfo/Idh/MocA family oxidoreductase [Sediminispirochaeta sp.]
MHDQKVKWGILGTARIATKSIIPGIQRSKNAEIQAIASRNDDLARKTALKFGIPTHYGSYEELLQDPEIEVVYIPLPNHLHVEWSRRALEAGKHVLCEKPLALNTEDVQELVKLRNKKKLKIGEAFMVRCHPQWLEAQRIVQSPKFGPLRLVQGTFSYFNRDEKNIRNNYPIAEGGGALWDIGCYPVHTSRFMFGEEPQRVLALVEKDPQMPVDRLVSAILEFPSGQALFSSSTQLVPFQRMSFFGEQQHLELPSPFNPPEDTPTVLQLHNGKNPNHPPREVVLAPSNQYSLQADEFSRAVRENTEVPVPLESSLWNTAVLVALHRSAVSGGWVEPTIE